MSATHLTVLAAELITAGLPRFEPSTCWPSNGWTVVLYDQPLDQETGLPVAPLTPGELSSLHQQIAALDQQVEGGEWELALDAALQRQELPVAGAALIVLEELGEPELEVEFLSDGTLLRTHLAADCELTLEGWSGLAKLKQVAGQLEAVANTWHAEVAA